MWSKFHQLRTSMSCKKLWENFLKISLMDDNNNPIMYQHISTLVFKELIKESFQLPHFKIPEIKFFFSQTLCQDPLENFFGCQRQMGGTNDNPTIQEFQKNTQALRVVNSLCRPVVKGNCRGNTEVIMNKENIDCPLPRRSAKRRKI